jgi:hypothetical protein
VLASLHSVLKDTEIGARRVDKTRHSLRLGFCWPERQYAGAYCGEESSCVVKVPIFQQKIQRKGEFSQQLPHEHRILPGWLGLIQPPIVRVVLLHFDFAQGGVGGSLFIKVISLRTIGPACWMI